MKYAGFWLRFFPFIIDSLLYLIAYKICRFFILHITGINLDNFISTGMLNLTLTSLVSTILWSVIFGLFESSKWQASPGKMLFKLKVAEMDGTRLNFAKGFARNFLKGFWILGLNIPYMMAGWTKKKQALHDIIVQTLVLDTAAKPEPNEPSEPAVEQKPSQPSEPSQSTQKSE